MPRNHLSKDRTIVTQSGIQNTKKKQKTKKNLPNGQNIQNQTKIILPDKAREQYQIVAEKNEKLSVRDYKKKQGSVKTNLSNNRNNHPE